MRIIVFFTFNIGLLDWIERGLQFRELNYWRALMSRGINVEIVTFDEQDTKIEEYLESNGLGGIIVHKLGKFHVSRLLAFLRTFLSVRRTIATRSPDQTTIIKTNQVRGWFLGFLVSIFTNNFFIVRFGYIPSQLYRDRRSYIKYIFALCSEALAIFFSNRTFVCGESSFNLLCNRPSSNKSKISRIFNYIDGDYAPSNLTKIARTDTALFVGRLETEKNPELAILAALKIGFSLTLAGDGSLRNDLEKRYRDYGNVKFIGNVKRDQLIVEYQKHNLFLITSFNEGMPKALMEAISSGCHPIGFDSPGSGVLLDKYGTSCSSVSNVSFLSDLESLLVRSTEKLKHRAELSSECLREFSLDGLIALEIALLGEIMNNKYVKV